MIIAITGSNGVGKDTVSSIISYLRYKKNVESGKETNLNFTLQHFIKGNVTAANWSKRSFASNVNRCFLILTNEFFSELDREKKEKLRPKFIEFAETCKKMFGEDVWVKALFRDYENGVNWIITDLRFDVELQEIKKHEHLIIEVSKEPKESPYILIVNDGTIDELVEKVKTILENDC